MHSDRSWTTSETHWVTSMNIHYSMCSAQPYTSIVLYSVYPKGSPSLCCCWRWSISVWLLSALFYSCRSCWKDPSDAMERKYSQFEHLWSKLHKETKIRGQQAVSLVCLTVFKVQVPVAMLWLRWHWFANKWNPRGTFWQSLQTVSTNPRLVIICLFLYSFV